MSLQERYLDRCRRCGADIVWARLGRHEVPVEPTDDLQADLAYSWEQGPLRRALLLVIGISPIAARPLGPGTFPPAPWEHLGRDHRSACLPRPRRRHRGATRSGDVVPLDEARRRRQGDIT
ncbi:hypothetical protein [Bailinhaonella thermotolerans]|uniref:Uncharacterized protein n=1 Tax=Bailinhaonella thermotolerans TaxID=1070861 RepID=A0A3A4A603_9ACTN|nr:hypothetical protein [Bailinhaonella thermotolerans]RJL21083.1 hypothetical protein D5H75_38370 [Bailinhaonella thermotolerans]